MSWSGSLPVPLIADVHFDYRLAVAALHAGAAGVRINPGNIGGPEKVSAVVEAARAHGAAIRIGVNSGSLERDLRPWEDRDPAGALVESAVRHCALLEDLDFRDIKVSAKSSSPLVTVAANRLLAERIPYPLHLGVTEAGTPWTGSIRSAVARESFSKKGSATPSGCLSPATRWTRSEWGLRYYVPLGWHPAVPG